MARLALLLVALLFAAAVDASAQKRCTKGIPCGNTCIAANKTCRVGSGTARSSGSTRASQAAPVATPVAALPDDALFVASSRGQAYYPRSCRAWHNLNRANLITFKTEEEAQAAGYRRTTNRACGTAEAVAAASGEAVSQARGAAVPTSAEICRIESISDGDTVACADGRRIRLLLIDTPEMDQGPFGMEARKALAALLPLGTTATVEMDVEPTDRYGRTLAYLYAPDGRLVNEEMARQGYALMLTYPPNVKYVERIQAAVADAQASGRGLWGGSAFECAPRDHRAGRCDT